MNTPSTGAVVVPCPRCGLAAPRLIAWRQANDTAPRVECPRCAYPQQRYLGSWVDTMPASDQQWYATHADQAVNGMTTPSATGCEEAA